MPTSSARLSLAYDPLYDDNAANPSAVTRDYVFDGGWRRTVATPLLSVFGGKITTYRKLAEHAIGRIKPGSSHAWADAWTDARDRCPAAILPDKQISSRFANRHPAAAIPGCPRRWRSTMPASMERGSTPFLATQVRSPIWPAFRRAALRARGPLSVRD